MLQLFNLARVRNIQLLATFPYRDCTLPMAGLLTFLNVGSLKSKTPKLESQLKLTLAVSLLPKQQSHPQLHVDTERHEHPL